MGHTKYYRDSGKPASNVRHACGHEIGYLTEHENVFPSSGSCPVCLEPVIEVPPTPPFGVRCILNGNGGGPGLLTTDSGKLVFVCDTFTQRDTDGIGWRSNLLPPSVGGYLHEEAEHDYTAEEIEWAAAYFKLTRSAGHLGRSYYSVSSLPTSVRLYQVSRETDLMEVEIVSDENLDDESGKNQMRVVQVKITDVFSKETGVFFGRDIFDVGWVVNPAYALIPGMEEGGLLQGDVWQTFHSDKEEKAALESAIPRSAFGLPLGWTLSENDKRYTLKDVPFYQRTGRVADVSLTIEEQIEGDKRDFISKFFGQGKEYPEHIWEVTDSAGEFVAGAPSRQKVVELALEIVGHTNDTKVTVSKESGWYEVRSATLFELRAMKAMYELARYGVRM
jgi:hypothetical protein